MQFAGYHVCPERGRYRPTTGCMLAFRGGLSRAPALRALSQPAQVPDPTVPPSLPSSPLLLYPSGSYLASQPLAGVGSLSCVTSLDPVLSLSPLPDTVWSQVWPVWRTQDMSFSSLNPQRLVPYMA